MKKALILFLMVSLFTVGCTKNVTQKDSIAGTECLKGVLVKKGICGQRVIQITSQNKDGVAYATKWTDGGKTYNNVFTVSNTCTFPATLNEGDEFNFELTSTIDNNCIQCQAYTPVPDEKNNINVIADCIKQQN